MVILAESGCFGYCNTSITLPETEKTSHLPGCAGPQKETIVFQPSMFRCYISFREGKWSREQFLDFFCVKKANVESIEFLIFVCEGIHSGNLT